MLTLGERTALAFWAALMLAGTNLIIIMIMIYGPTRNVNECGHDVDGIVAQNTERRAVQEKYERCEEDLHVCGQLLRSALRDAE
jgi:hypothetical protein